MNLFKNIFGGKKNVVDEVLDGIDSNTLTTQEVLEYRLKSYSFMEPFKLMQRVLAFMFCFPYVVAWVVTFTMKFTGVEVPPDAGAMLEGRMGLTVSLITGFYFFGGTIASAIKR